MIQLALGDDVRWSLRPGPWLAIALYGIAIPLFTLGLAMAPSLRDPWLVLLPASAAILGPAWQQASIDRPKGLPRTLARAAVRVGLQAAAVVTAMALAMQLNPQLASDDVVRPAALFSLAVAALLAGEALWDGVPRRGVSIVVVQGALGVAGLFAAMAIWGLWAVLASWVATATAILVLVVLERRRAR